MAGELQVAHTAAAATIYALIRDGTARVWDVAGANFEAYLTAQLGNYDVVMTEEGTASQYYIGTFPSTIAAGSYRATYHVQAGGSPAEGDTLISTEWFEWSGSVILPRAAWALMSADPIGPPRTWTARTDRAVCREIIEVTTSDTAVYAMDFSALLNPGTSVLTADSVSDTSGNSLTTSSLAVAQDKMAVLFTVTASDLTADTNYNLRVTYTSTDGDTHARDGKLRSLP